MWFRPTSSQANDGGTTVSALPGRTSPSVASITNPQQVERRRRRLLAELHALGVATGETPHP
jgi:hypothetical protein